MKPSILSGLFIGSQLAMATPAINPAAVLKDKAPTVGDFESAIMKKRNITDNVSVFSTRGGSNAAIAFAEKHKYTRLEDVAVLDADRRAAWMDEKVYTQVVDNWNQAFAELSSGTVWIVSADDREIDPKQDPIWNATIFPALMHSHIDEVVQVDGRNISNIQQVWPEEVRKTPGQCKWYGTAPTCLSTCPPDTTLQTASLFGPDFDVCETGRKVYCCT